MATESYIYEILNLQLNSYEIMNFFIVGTIAV